LFKLEPEGVSNFSLWYLACIDWSHRRYTIWCLIFTIGVPCWNCWFNPVAFMSALPSNLYVCGIILVWLFFLCPYCTLPYCTMFELCWMYDTWVTFLDTVKL
jgi:hypothetical protein